MPFELLTDPEGELPELGSHELLIHLLTEALGSPGLVVDEATAKATPCTCFRLPDRDLCFSRGVIGMLTPEQETTFCVVGKVYREEGPARRVAKFREAAEECKRRIAEIPRGERLRPWLECMGEELRARGIEI